MGWFKVSEIYSFFDVIFQKNWSDVINETKRKKNVGNTKSKKKNTLTWNNIIFFFLLIILIFFGSHHFFIPIDFYVFELIRNFFLYRNGWGFRWFLNGKIIGNSLKNGVWGFPVSTQYSHPDFWPLWPPFTQSGKGTSTYYVTRFLDFSNPPPPL